MAGNEIDLEKLTRDYIDVFQSRDLEACMAYFLEESTINWQIGVYKGLRDILEWHKDRFKADLRIVQIDALGVENGQVVLDGIVTSEVLKAWRLKSLAGRVKVGFENARIREMSFSVRISNPLEQWS